MLARLLKVALAGAGLAAVTAAAALFVASPFPVGGPSAREAREWVGAIHVHTVASDGGGTVDEVARAARAAGLDFVTLTDHNTWAMPAPIYRDGRLLVLGEEASVPAGHILVIGGDDPEVRRTRRSAAAERGTPLGPSVPAGGGLRIVAHPEGPGTPWTYWDASGFDALEIWNWDTDLRDDGLGDWWRALLLLPTEPVGAMLELVDRPALTLERWDELLAGGHRTAAVCSVDAHSNVRLTEGVALRFPAYQDLFRLARQHVLLGAEPTGDAARDAALVTEALRLGRGFCALDAVADASGFRAAAVNERGAATFGDVLRWGGGPLRITASAPVLAAPTVTRLFRDGSLVSEGRGPGYDSGDLAEPGAYRLEVYVELARGLVPWIFTNPIWVRREPAESDAARRPPSAEPTEGLPVEMVPPPRTQLRHR